MKTLALVLSAALSLSGFPAFAGAPVAPDKFITLAQADVRLGPNGITLGDRDRDRDRDRHRDRVGEGRDRDRDRHCKTVTIEENGTTRTERKCQ